MQECCLISIPFIDLSSLRTVDRISTAKIKSRSDKGHPGQIPLVILKLSDNQPLFFHNCLWFCILRKPGTAIQIQNLKYAIWNSKYVFGNVFGIPNTLFGILNTYLEF